MKRSILMILALAVGLVALADAQEVLPRPDQPFGGKIEKVTIELQKAKAADKAEAEQSRKEASLKIGLLD